MKLIHIQNILEEWCPLQNAEDFDNVGLLVGDPDSKINKALITIDTTENIIDEAISKNCNLIITFHPLIFKGIKSLKSENYVNKCIIKAVKNNINIYAIHTNLDNNPEGVSFKIAQKLNLINTSLLIQKTRKQQSWNGNNR
jgi:putative NIF3 family GTP cyclohydrolase 1 type 2